MTIESLNKRLDRLDSDRPVADRRVIQLTRKEDESDAAAIARWCEAHPDEPPLVDDDNTLIIMRTIVGPKGPTTLSAIET